MHFVRWKPIKHKTEVSAVAVTPIREIMHSRSSSWQPDYEWKRQNNIKPIWRQTRLVGRTHCAHTQDQKGRPT